MNKTGKSILDIIIRYVILIAVAFPNLFIFYFIFTPLTFYGVYFLSSLFFKTIIFSNTLLIGNALIEIIPACVAGSAYYLLFILNFSTAEIKFLKRIKMILFSFLCLLILNILRIFFLAVLLNFNFQLFDIVHMIFWYALSIIFVVLIWFAEVKIFKIKTIPFYSDIRHFNL